jgi:hypothetical protein
MHNHVTNVFNERRLKKEIKSEEAKGEDYKFKLGTGTLCLAQDNSVSAS